ncbi:MAG: cytidylate kinase-like family protein [Lachnospiraceae bacterium]|nr:cytidylate kinase-like family protein [Lachnospiraceae bacterium]MCI9545456.1 cytidylate kinase-like family protein [Lachnospiraceae bacterium]
MGYQIVAIEREYATGGQDIGARVGEMLGIPCYGRDILQMAAQEWNTKAEYIEHLEENFTNSLLYSIGMAARAAGQGDGLTEEGRLFLTENQIVERLAMEGRCVFVGRCAGWALRERTDVLNVFIYANHEYRMRRAVESYGISEKEAQSVLKRFDKRRSGFYEANTARKWRDRQYYHMMLDSSKLGVEVCAKMIAQFL